MTTQPRKAAHKVDPQRSAGSVKAARTLKSEHAALRKNNPKAYKAYTKRIHAVRHAAAVKSAATRKSNKARGLSMGDVSCCAAQALAASLRLAGAEVGDEDILALYWHTARTPGQGASIADTLAAAQEFGLAGVLPASFTPVDVLHGFCILGVELPGSHAVLDLGEHWATWNQFWPVSEFRDALIEEAWEVTWETARRSATGGLTRPETSPTC